MAVQLNISYTDFVRTTDEKHQAVVKALLKHVWESGDIYQDTYSGKYCVGCEEYKDDEDLDSEGNCLVHKTPCPQRNEVRCRAATDWLAELARSNSPLFCLNARTCQTLPPVAHSEVRCVKFCPAPQASTSSVLELAVTCAQHNVVLGNPSWDSANLSNSPDAVCWNPW